MLRSVATGVRNLEVPQTSIGNLFTGWGRMIVVYWRQQVRGNVAGVLIGALPGAGADRDLVCTDDDRRIPGREHRAQGDDGPGREFVRHWANAFCESSASRAPYRAAVSTFADALAASAA